MKKALLSIFTFVSIGAFAQLPNGSAAPDFTATDIYGNSHTLSDYLNEGKHVLLNISATWCGPCWNYHNSHALGDFYKAYGPNGSDEATVLYIEGDGATSIDAIFGVGNSTLGDWTQGTPYPIIDAASVASSYQITYFPTLYRICADAGTVTELNQLTAPNLRNNVNLNCSTLIGVPNHAEVTVADIYACDSSIEVTARVKNYGNNNVTSAIIVLKEDGEIIATKDYSGNTIQFATATVLFDAIEINEESTYTVEIQSLNGGDLHHTPYGTTEIENIIVANTAEHIGLQVNVYTDNYPSEISWRIKDASGAVIANGGPYQAGTADQWGGGGPDANTTKTHYITVSPSECYSVELLDQFGDGWAFGASNPNAPGLEVLKNEESIIYVPSTGSFSNNNPLVRPAAFKTGETLGAGDFQVVEFSIYPNPSTGVFNINTSEVIDIKVVDITGKVVYQSRNIENSTVLNLSSLQKGVYLIQVSGETLNRTEKIILN